MLILVAATLSPTALTRAALRPSIVAARRHAALALQQQPPEPPEPTKLPEPPPEDDSPDDLGADYEAGKAYGASIRARFLSPRIDDRGLPFADALVCVGGSLFIAQWALSPAVPDVLKIPLPSWLAPTLLPSGVNWRGVPYILPALSHGAALAGCWVLGALAAAAYEREAYTSTVQVALAKTWRAGAFAIGILILSTQVSLYVSLSSQGLDPTTVPTTAGIDSGAPADVQILQTAFELICDCAVQAVQLTLFRLFRWREGQSEVPP